MIFKLDSQSKFNKLLVKIKEDTKIEKPLTMHIARHSFANIAGNKIPLKVLQKLYRHSSIVTTATYQGSFYKEEKDNALDAVLDF
ncbi:tyrosine-type recombinase/integrase [Sphingobacteriaceae bacterium AH-315-L07]|nr:tyrosine-type recombinase/integrase [Sphingobacteriaceae bacterium AH-315-L07]